MLRRYVTLHRRGLGSHPRSCSAVPTSIRRSLVATTSELAKTARSGNPPQYVQYGHAGALHAILLSCHLRGSLQRKSSPSDESTVGASLSLSSFFSFRISYYYKIQFRNNRKVKFIQQMSVRISEADRLPRSSAEDLSIGTATMYI